MVDYLRSEGVDDIEVLIATHPHSDHIGGLSSVFDAFRVEQVISPEEPKKFRGHMGMVLKDLTRTPYQAAQYGQQFSLRQA